MPYDGVVMSGETSDPRLLATECEMELTTGSQGCFHQRSSGVRLGWSGSSASLTVGGRAQSASRDEVQAIAGRIVQAAERPEVSQNARSTTGYQATWRWRFRASTTEPWTSGEATFASRDLPPEEVEALVKARPELAKRVPAGMYARAIGLHELVASLERAFPSSPGVR